MYINTLGGWHPSTSLSWFIQGTSVVPEKLHSPPERHSTTGLVALMSFDLECIQLQPLERNHQCWLGTYMNLWKDIYREIILKPINKSIIPPQKYILSKQESRAVSKVQRVDSISKLVPRPSMCPQKNGKTWGRNKHYFIPSLGLQTEGLKNWSGSSVYFTLELWKSGSPSTANNMIIPSVCLTGCLPKLSVNLSMCIITQSYRPQKWRATPKNWWP